MNASFKTTDIHLTGPESVFAHLSSFFDKKILVPLKKSSFIQKTKQILNIFLIKYH